MKYWLVKSEPSVYSFDQLITDGSTVWDGVRNYAARNHMKLMKKGDSVLFYHSNEGKEIVGIAKVAKEHYHDPTAGEEDWVVVELKPIKKLKKTVTLAQIKNDIRLNKISLVTIPRLSVMPASEAEFTAILEMSS